MKDHKFSGNYVYFKYGSVNCLESSSMCYSGIKKKDFGKDCALELKYFLRKETLAYAKEYILMLEKIFKCTIEWCTEDHIKVNNFKDFYMLKIFTTLFRFLFEQGYSNHKLTVKFLKSFTDKKDSEDFLLSLIESYNDVSFTVNNTNHDLRNDEKNDLKLRTTEELENFKFSEEKYSPVHNFFNKK
jgi:hypothetical protein